MNKFSDELMSWLKELGYTHCFFLAGGGSMHLVDSASRFFNCVPVVHEVSAVIATEYFNESNTRLEKAFALLTTGPGLTNAITGIAGAWLESRECLIIGGQVKKNDLASIGLRQKGIQEVNGIELVSSITKSRLRISQPVARSVVEKTLEQGFTSRKGPVFLEICIDASASTMESSETNIELLHKDLVRKKIPSNDLDALREMLSNSFRPLLLLGSGVERKKIESLESEFTALGVPLASTWTGADRTNVDYKYYAGRPNTYGMRWANVFQQQSDLLIAVGTRLNLQQTGFNYQEYMPVGKIVQVDIDEAELRKENPGIDLGINMDSSDFLDLLLMELNAENAVEKRAAWLEFLEVVRRELPVIEDSHEKSNNFTEPYSFINKLSQLSKSNDIVVPCSSGGTFTATHQSYLNKRGQQLISNKGLASMGYGLAGAIGAAFSEPSSRILLLEGDGGFAQNLQELGTVSQNRLNIKMFIFSNEGYASIRSSQVSYFEGNYVGCDKKTGLGLPIWKRICEAYDIRYVVVQNLDVFLREHIHHFESDEPVFFEVMTDPNLLYFPKVSSKISVGGMMTSAPIHDMSPRLLDSTAELVFKYLPNSFWKMK